MSSHRLLSFLLFLSFACASSGAQACYTAREIEAEQGIRIHSELMVIGLTCIKMPRGEQLYTEYQRFTQKNSDLIASYEENLINYYKSEGDRNPELKLHTLRTNMANEISRRAIAMSTLSFCQKYASNIDKALAMDTLKVRRWAQHTWPSQPVSEHRCRS